MKYTLLTSIVLGLIACNTTHDAPNNMINHVFNNYTIDTCKLRDDGMYNVYDTTKLHNGNKVNDEFTTSREVVFLKNGKIFKSGGYSIDSLIYKDEYWVRLSTEYINLWGNYRIINDSIYAYSPFSLSIGGGRFKPFYANFIGYVKNKDTILNWRMVPPYPDVDPEINNYFINDTTPQLLYFIKNNAIRVADSLLSQ